MLRWLKEIRDKTAETVLRQQTALVRGKVAGKTVEDDSGGLLIDAGQTVDEAIIQRAIQAGKMAALVASVMAAQAQDMKEKASSYLEKLPEGQESRSLGSVEDYAEARTYVGRVVGMDVTDIRGHVIVPAGRQITDEDVRAAREAGQLRALIYAAQQAPPPDLMKPAPQQPPPAQPRPETPPPHPRPTLPLMNPNEKPDEAES